MRTSETIGKVSAAIVEALGNMGNAVKDSKNPFFKSTYADINSIREAAMPSLQAAKLTILQPPAVHEGKNYIETIILHESGEYVSSLNEVIVAKQNDPQSYLAAQTYTRRGALQAFLNMGSVDDDGNTASNRPNNTQAVSTNTPARTFGSKPEVAPESKPALTSKVDITSPLTIKADTRPEEPTTAPVSESPAPRRGSFGVNRK